MGYIGRKLTKGQILGIGRRHTRHTTEAQRWIQSLLGDFEPALTSDTTISILVGRVAPDTSCWPELRDLGFGAIHPAEALAAGREYAGVNAGRW